MYSTQRAVNSQMLNWPKNPVISTAAPHHVRKLVASKDWTSSLGKLAIQIVETQLANHQTRTREWAAAGNRVSSLFDVAANRLADSIGEDLEEDVKTIEALPLNILSRAAMKMENIPYELFCRGRQNFSDGDGNVDEWILRNEIWMRDAYDASKEQQREPSGKNCYTTLGKASTKESITPDWTRGLVRLSTHADAVFPGSVLTDSCRSITRPTCLLGFSILGGRRPPVIHIQPSVQLFRETFETMTDGLLKGLEWENVCVAGGIVLGALLCTKTEQTTNTPAQWENSDVDMYIHGLGPVEANKKIEHIFDVFKRNLPPGAPVLIVRNSKTITLFSKFPLRRIQLVLKLVDSPKDVLLNCDLDICAIGWDGNEVWMLPRAARTLETGYTVFTMDLIHGHYLGDRRATREQRVFKYADRGYGIRILPSYLEELRIIKDTDEKRESLQITDEDSLDFEEIIRAARKWTLKAIGMVVGLKSSRPNPPPTFSHAWLQERHQRSIDSTRRSSLSCLNLFMRHVALWEHELTGDIILEKNSWPTQTYDEIYTFRFGVSYDDTPKYQWDKEFKLEDLIDRIDKENEKLIPRLSENIFTVFNENRRTWTVEARFFDYLLYGFRIQRVTHSRSMQDILRQPRDIYVPVWLPEEFLSFAENLVENAVQESGVPGYNSELFAPILKDDITYPSGDPEDLRLVLWRITSITMWQQLSHAIDEVHEVLSSFQFANAGLFVDEDMRLKLLLSQFGKRVIRKTAQNELIAFARWVATPPFPISADNPRIGGIDELT